MRMRAAVGSVVLVSIVARPLLSVRTRHGILEQLPVRPANDPGGTSSYQYPFSGVLNANPAPLETDQLI